MFTCVWHDIDVGVPRRRLLIAYGHGDDLICA